jgi:hypothetical protein
MIRASYAIVYGKHNNHGDAQILQWRVCVGFRSSLQIFISYQMREPHVIAHLNFEFYCTLILKKKADDDRELSFVYKTILLLPIISIIFIKLF